MSNPQLHFFSKGFLKSVAFFIPICIMFFCIPLSANAQIIYPTPSYVYSPLTPRVGDVVTFDALWWEKYWIETYGNRSFSYSWYFGDNISASGVTVSHTFTNPGIYGVGVTVVDNLGYGGTSEMSIEVRERTPVTVYAFLSSDTIYTGQEVTVGGNLTYNGVGVPDEWILLSSKTYHLEGVRWTDITSAKTDKYGKFSAIWKPVFGYYDIKATWAGNSTYPETSVSINLQVKGFGNLITEFSSNSTITGLNFNSSTLILSFSAEGPNGTNGYVNLTLEKDPAFDPERIKVLLDEHPIEYTVDSTSQSWFLFFGYTHSIHSIVVSFKTDEILESPTESSFSLTPSPSIPEFSSTTLLLFLIITTLAVVVIKTRKES
jgi:hypothetical protein